METINNGSTYFIKSDIKEFFTSIKIDLVMDILRNDLKKEDKFLSLVEHAIKVEVDKNSLQKLKNAGTEYYNFEEKGVPQGCCLSPIFGNILLYKFDNAMNTSDVTCLRYLDDFIIFAPNQKIASGAFRKAKQILKNLNLEVYDPKFHTDKAEEGSTSNKFDYLGITIHKNNIRPNKKSKKNLLTKINGYIDEVDKKPYEVLSSINNTINGWKKQYSFCNDNNYFKNIDTEIDKFIDTYMESVYKKINCLKQEQPEKKGHTRNIFGVSYLNH